MTATLSTSSAWFRYHGATPWVVQDCSLSFSPGITAIVGPNGSGKSTLLRLLLGVMRPQRGVVSLSERSVHGVRPEERAARIAYISQRPEMSAGFTVREVVSLGRFALPRNDAAVEGALDRAIILDLADRPWRELSVGQQQLVSVARVVAQLHGASDVPRALLADEPTAAMDPVHVGRTAEILREIANSGVAVITASHDLALARAMADRAVLLGAGGTVLSHGPVAETLTPAMLERLFGVSFVLARSDAGTTIATSAQIARGV